MHTSQYRQFLIRRCNPLVSVLISAVKRSVHEGSGCQLFFKYSGKGGEQFEERRYSVAVRDETDTSGPWLKDLTASVPGACTLPARNRFTNLPPFVIVLNSIPNSNSVLVLPSTVICV
jgi:hypothetical protein